MNIIVHQYRNWRALVSVGWQLAPAGPESASRLRVGMVDLSPGPRMG